MRRAHITWFCLHPLPFVSGNRLLFRFGRSCHFAFQKSPAILWWVLFSCWGRRSLDLQVYGGYMTCFKSLNCLLGWTDNTARCKCEQSWNEIRLLRSHLSSSSIPEVCFPKGKEELLIQKWETDREIWIQLHCILAHRQGVSKCPMIYWVAISLWILFLHVFLQGSGGALHIHADKIDPQEEDGNTSCYASTFYSVHRHLILLIIRI